MDLFTGLGKTGKVARRSLRSFLLAALVSLTFSFNCFASTITLQWDADAIPNLAGYHVYYSADTAAAPFTGTGATEGASPLNASTQTSTTITGLDPSRPYYFAVTAYDTAGVESSYSNIVSVPELVAPITSISFPANATTVSGTVSVTADASDNVGVTKVEFYVDGLLQASDTASPYLFSWNTAALPAGTYTLMTKAYDAAGNVGQSANTTVTVANDTIAPLVSLSSPANNATVSGTVTIAANASDNVGVTRVEFYENGSLLYAANVSPFNYNWDTTTVANGGYTLSAKAYDAAGNVAQATNVSVTVSNVIADTSAPTVTGFTMPSTAKTRTVAVSSFTASDNVGVTGYLITESDTPPLATATGWSAAAPTSYTFSGTGTKTAYAWAKDAAGNVSASRSDSVKISAR